jgi:hypothetical protein
MRNNDSAFFFGPNYNLATDSVFSTKNRHQGAPFPPTSGDFDLLDGTNFKLLDSTDFLLL